MQNAELQGALARLLPSAFNVLQFSTVVHPSSKPAPKEIATEKYSGFQRHMQVSIYRCFLPDLTGFTDLHCIGPKSSGIHDNQIFCV